MHKYYTKTIQIMSRLNMDFDTEEDQYILALKKKHGIKRTTELIRFLIKSRYNQLPSTDQKVGGGTQ